MRKAVQWRGCYRGAFDLHAGESMAHPAKMAAGLAFRILAHLEERGLLTPDMAVLDFMCGTGTTLFAAALQGYRAYGIELEPRFVGFAEANKARLEAKLRRPLDITIMQGDARQMGSLLEGHLRTVGVVSPPYADAINSTEGGIDWEKAGRRDRLTPSQTRHAVQGASGDLKYGSTPGQIGSLPDRPRIAAVVSPPYGHETAFHDPHFTPPHDSKTGVKEAYGSTPGQIGSLPDRPRIAAVVSPPYEDMENDGARKMPEHYFDQVGGIRHTKAEAYGTTFGQVGQERGDDYLSAMLQVYQAAARVCDVLAVVTKNPTRQGRLRRLDKDTLSLLKAAGFTPVCYHQAVLFEEDERTDLFGAVTRKPRGRLGFFKRLQYQKGAPIADHEDVFIMRRLL